LRIKGIRGELDGVTLFTRWHDNGQFRAVVRGAPLTLIYEEERRYKIKSKDTGWFLSRGLTQTTSHTALAVGDGKLVDGKDLVRRYIGQRESGLNQRLAPVDREARMAAQAADLNDWIVKSTAACGGLKMRIDWSTVKDEWFEEFSISNQCSTQAVYVGNFCNRHPHRVKELQGGGSMTCTFSGLPSSGEHIRPRLGEDGGLIFTARSRSTSWKEPMIELRALYGESEQVLRGKSNHFIVRDDKRGSQRVYNGDGKTFYPNGSLSENSGDAHDQLSYGVRQAHIARRDGRYFLACEGKDEEEELEVLTGEARQALLKAAVVKSEPKWQRLPYFLARDSRGIYYYVDRMRGKAGRRYRVFTGRRGQLKLSKLKGVVEDTVGSVFSTDAGELRLVVNNKKSTGTWIRGKKKLALTTVNVFTNRQLIYDELGAYFGEDFGFVCDG
jgi:hypothetical protein